MLKLVRLLTFVMLRAALVNHQQVAGGCRQVGWQQQQQQQQQDVAGLTHSCWMW